ncbi:MAG: flagellar brake protein [Bacillota bacterium]|nr:flagellar brake protein [Bacillota bacterium]
MTTDIQISNPAEVFRPGTSVSIEYTDGAGKIRAYNTYVHDARPDALVLALPTESGIGVGVEPGQELDLRRADDQEAYRAKVCVLEAIPGQPPLLRVSTPDMVEMRPRRRFFRVDVDIPFTTGGQHGRILNMSGSGLLLAASQIFVEGSRFKVAFVLPDSAEKIVARVKVLRALSKRKVHYAGVVFEDLEHAVQDRLVKHVFDRQRELAKRGLLVRDPRLF